MGRKEDQGEKMGKGEMVGKGEKMGRKKEINFGRNFREKGHKGKEQPGKKRQSLEGSRVEGRAERCEKALGERGEAGKDHGEGKKGSKSLPGLSNRQQQNLKITPNGDNWS